MIDNQECLTATELKEQSSRFQMKLEDFCNSYSIKMTVHNCMIETEPSMELTFENSSRTRRLKMQVSYFTCCRYRDIDDLVDSIIYKLKSAFREDMLE